MASLVEARKLAGADPQRYLTDPPTGLVHGWPDSRIDGLMPWRRAADEKRLTVERTRDGPEILAGSSWDPG